MRLNSAIALVITLLMYSCGDGSSEKAQSIKLSKEMKSFMESIKGSYKDVTVAMEKHAEKEILDDDITRLDLKNPKVTAQENLGSGQVCYTMEAEIGVTKKAFVICWEKAKIYSIEDLGFQ